VTIQNKYTFRCIVYLKTDPDQAEYVVTSIRVDPGNVIRYLLAYCEDTAWYYDFEITQDEDKNKKFK
jgi:hypothetical protein